MSVFTRIILIATLAFLIAGGLAAQETTTTAEASAETTTATTDTTTETAAETSTAATTTAPSAELALAERQRLREEFNGVIARHPASVGGVLASDPTMVLNEPFVSRYPDLAAFIAQHPEIRRNPHYYIYETVPNRPRQPFEEAIETLSIVAVFALIAFALGWLIRTIIEQKRWNQLSRRQSEVHSKLLDRFGSSAEVLDYIKTPAGTKFLESAPIPLHVEKAATQNAPLSRIVWSIQVGVILAVTALGMLLLSVRFDDEGEGFFALGAIALSVGLGFIASAVVSLTLSRRLGPKDPDGVATGSLDDSEVMR